MCEQRPGAWPRCASAGMCGSALACCPPPCPWQQRRLLVPHLSAPRRLPRQIKLSGGLPYTEHSCWDDIHDTLVGAKRFILITGWSIWTDTKLRRQPLSEEDSLPLGELLVKKANEGVMVRPAARRHDALRSPNRHALRMRLPGRGHAPSGHFRALPSLHATRPCDAAPSTPPPHRRCSCWCGTTPPTTSACTRA